MQDVPLGLRELLALKIGCEHSRTAGHVGLTSLKAAEYAYRICEVMGVPFEMSIFPLDPLRVEGDTLSMAMELLAKGFRVELNVQSMPIQGVTTPIHLVGAFVENVATVLATLTVLRLVGVEQDLDIHFDVFPFDMKLGAIAYGTPEHVLIYLMGAQVTRYYGGRGTYCKAFHTNANFPDAHSITQRASFATVAALNGARDFHFGGMLGIDKVFSAEQLVIDTEIVKYVRKIVEGVPFDDEKLGFDMIREVGPGGDYLPHPSTVENFRGLWGSRFFENVSPEQWAASGRKGPSEKVREYLAELREGYDYVLDPDKQREIDEIYEAAVKELT